MSKDKMVFAADIGGTHARLGMVSFADEEGQDLQVMDCKTYVCSDFADLSSILDEYFRTIYNVPVQAAVIASAGYLDGDEIRTTNMRWEFSLSEIKQYIGVQDVFVINDYVAAAHGLRYLDSGDILSVNPQTHPMHNEPVLVMGPGTGLGAAVLIPGEDRPTILQTEAGQAAFTSSTDLENDIHKILRKRLEYVSVETVLSGPGLLNLYHAYSEVMGSEVSLQTPEAITETALQDKNSMAYETLILFCDLLGSTLGDMALLYGTRGGIFLAGGILPAIRKFLNESNFLSRFVEKGSMCSFLHAIPVNLVTQGHLGVTGAAAWFKELSLAREQIPVAAFAGT